MLRALQSCLIAVAFAWSVLIGGALAQTQPQARSGEPKVVIVTSDVTAAYVDAVQALMDGLSREGINRYDMRQMTAAEFLAFAKLGQTPRAKVFVALGLEASNALAQTSAVAPVLSFLIPRAGFDRVLRGSGRKASSQFSAIYLDQPLERQLGLIELALPDAKSVGVLWGPDSFTRAPALRLAATNLRLTLVESMVTNQQAVFPGLRQVLNESNVLLAMPDPQVYNSNSVQNILLSAFREKVPMLAFSPAYVKAGALLGLYVTPTQAGKHAALLVLDVLRDRTLPSSPVESNDFEVAVNEHVARVMSLTLDTKTLRQDLRRLERLP